MAPRSEPAWGSVRFIVPVHSPDTSLGRNTAFCRSVPWVLRASIAARVSIGQRPNAMLAPWIISNTATSSARGRPWPPWASAADSPFQPPDANCL